MFRDSFQSSDQVDTDFRPVEVEASSARLNVWFVICWPVDSQFVGLLVHIISIGLLICKSAFLALIFDRLGEPSRDANATGRVALNSVEDLISHPAVFVSAILKDLISNQGFSKHLQTLSSLLTPRWEVGGTKTYSCSAPQAPKAPLEDAKPCEAWDGTHRGARPVFYDALDAVSAQGSSWDASSFKHQGVTTSKRVKKGVKSNLIRRVGTE